MNNDFSNIIGNDSLKAILSDHIRSKTLSHAYIIEGPRNSGKKTLAKEICKALGCENKALSLPCGCCKACMRTDEGYNTDIYCLNRNDSASISVEDIRSLTSTMSYYPDDGDCKIYIIEEAERMTVQAQNALLLSLEEPPEYVVFLLLCEDSSLLLETVKSRAQCLKMQIFQTSFITELLKSRPSSKNRSDAEIARAAALSRGAIGNALDILSDKANNNALIADKAREFVELMCSDRRSDAILFASSVKYTRAEFEYFFDSAVLSLRDLLAIKYDREDVSTYEDINSASFVSKKLKVQKLVALYNSLLKAKDDICKNNVTMNTVMTTLAAEAVNERKI